MSRYSCIPMIYFEDMVLQRTMTLFEWLPIASQLTLDGTEIHTRTLPGYAPADLDGVRMALEAAGLHVSQVTTACDFTSPDPSYREAQVQHTMADIDAAAALGATCVRITAGQAHPGVTRADGVRWVIENFCRLLDHADGRVFLAFENHYKDYFWQHPDFSMRSDIFLEIVEQMRDTGLRINFDTSNQVMINEDPLPVLRAVVDLIVHVHCSDRVRPGEYQHAAAGEGIVDFPAVFRILKATGYDGWLSVEYNGTEGLDGLRQALAYVRRTWETLRAA